MASLSIDAKGLEKAAAYLQNIKNGLNIAAARAVNRTVDKGRTIVVGKIGEAAPTLKKTRIRKAITVARAQAKAGKTTARIRISKKRLPIADFGAKQTKAGVRATLAGKTSFFPRAFLATLASGHVGVFWRKKGASAATVAAGAHRKARVVSPSGLVSRLPIKELFGPSIGGVYENTSGLVEDVLGSLAVELNNRFEHEVQNLIRQATEKKT